MRLKARAALFLCLLCSAFCCFLIRSPLFEGKNYELYLGTSSGEISEGSAGKFFLPVTGESCIFEGDASALAESFHARLVFSERAAGITNYYYESPYLGDGVLLGGKRVNLHIAVGETVRVGTPLIFGGY